MNFFKFLYDVFVWLTNNYSQLPDGFRKSFPEKSCLSARLFLSSITQGDSYLNDDFAAYE